MIEPDPQRNAPHVTVPLPHAVPPQHPGEIGGPARGTTWPTVIGVISIVFGAGACLGGLWGLVAPHFMQMMADQMPQDQTAMWPDMREWAAWIVVSSILSIVIALILLVAGIDLLRRRIRAIKLGRVWAVLKMIFALVGAFVGFLIQQEQFQHMPQQNLPVGGSFYVVMSVVGVLFGIVWGCAFPVFMLVWFSRDKIKTEYAQWP